MLLKAPFAIQPQIQIGEERPMQGWVSPRYGQIEPAPVVNFSGKSHLPVRLVTALCLASASGNGELLDIEAKALEIWNGFEEEVEN